jgi:hypothetical protein
MSYLTHSAKIIKWWTEQGLEPTFEFRADGFDYWRIPVPAGDERLNDPALQALTREMLAAYDKVLQARFAAPLYVPELRHQVAMCKNKEGRYAVPISRSLYALQKVFLGPNNDKPIFRKLKRNNQVWNLLEDALKEGINSVLYFVDSEGRQAENFLLHMVLEALNVEEFRGPNIRIVQPLSDLAPGDQGVPEVQVEDGVSADGAGGGGPQHSGHLFGGSPGGNGGHDR